MIQLSQADGPAFSHTASTINSLFRRSVLDFPETVALVCPHQPCDLYGVLSVPLRDNKNGTPYLRWTYRALDHAIERFAIGLRSQGLRKGDPVLMFMANNAEYVIATWAVYRIGCVHVPINPRSLSNTREVQHMLRTTLQGCKTEAIGAILGNSESCPQVEELTAGLNCMKILVEGHVEGWIPFEDLMEEQNKVGQDKQCKSCAPEPECMGSSIFFTSGTTSLPKGCFVQTSSYPSTVATSWRQSWQPMLPGDRVALALPNNHAFSYMCLMSSFVNAATIVFPGSGFVPETVIQTIQQEQCSHTAFVPTMILALNGIPLPQTQKLSSLRRVLLAGAPPNEEVIRICLEHLGASGVENLYGMTEGILVSSNVVECANDIISGTNISIGSPLPGARVRVCAEGSRVPLPVGMAGEVHFSGPTLIKEYIGRADDDKFYLEHGKRWFCTGDKAIMGPDNRFYLVGRYKDTIIRGGENIEPSAIEAVLGQISEFHLLEPQIVRVPDHVAGELPVAIVNQDVDQETSHLLKSTIQTRMGSLYVPAAVVSVQSLGINVYPKTLAGKIQKAKLEELMMTYWKNRREQRHNAIDTGRDQKSRVRQGLAAFVNDRSLSPMQRKIWHDVASRVAFCHSVVVDDTAEQAVLAAKHQPISESYPTDGGNDMSVVEQSLGSQVVDSLLSAVAEEKGTQIDPTTRMVDLGIDSILSITILNRVRVETEFSLPSSLFFSQKTIGAIVDDLCSISSTAEVLDVTTPIEEAPPSACFSTLLQGTPKPGVPSLFLTPPGSGYAFSYDALPQFSDDFAIYSLGSPFLMTKSEATWTVEEAAALYVQTIRSLQGAGPYILGGWSMGAIIAYEIAYQLHQQGQQILGIINLDMPIPRPHPDNLEPTVKLLEILGFYPPIRRDGKPDMEIPAYRRQHSLSSVLAKMRYSPRPIDTPGNPTPVPIFMIWAGHGDPDRLPSVLCEANEILKKYGSGTQKRTGQEWLQIPRESFDSGGWAAMVGKENVKHHVIDHAAHDSMMDPEVVQYVADAMQQAIKGWLS